MSPLRRVHIDLPRWVIAVLVTGPFFTAAIASYAVIRGKDRSENNCEAVTGLRNDLVSTLRILEVRAVKRSPKNAEEIREGYNIMISRIQDPKCP